MKKFLEFIISQIIDEPENIEVEEIRNQESDVILNIISPKEKIGHLVGKEGRIIQAIRNLIKVLAVKENARVSVNIIEKGLPESI